MKHGIPPCSRLNHAQSCSTCAVWLHDMTAWKEHLWEGHLGFQALKRTGFCHGPKGCHCLVHSWFLFIFQCTCPSDFTRVWSSRGSLIEKGSKNTANKWSCLKLTPILPKSRIIFYWLKWVLNRVISPNKFSTQVSDFSLFGSYVVVWIQNLQFWNLWKFNCTNMARLWQLSWRQWSWIYLSRSIEVNNLESKL